MNIRSSPYEGKEPVSNRYEIIDWLRGLAILLVVIRHVQLRIPFEKMDVLMNWPEQLLSAIFVSGNEGVRIFFVISGFLITMNSLNRYSDLRHLDARKFYVLRFARIAPCLIGLLIILTAFHFWGVKGFIINSKFSYFETLFSALTFHLNWLEGQKGYLPPAWDVLWSLSVEEVFYFAFPLVCLISRNKTIIYTVLVALIIVGPLNRRGLEGNRIWQSKAYLSCMDSIAVGCLFALISHQKNLSTLSVHCFSFLGALLVGFILLIKRDPSFDVLAEIYVFKTILSVGVGLLLISAVRQKLIPTLQRLLSPLALYGRLSYEVYLTHVFVVIGAIRLHKAYDVNLNDSLIWLFGVVIVSGLLGYLVHRFCSEPMNLWIRKKYSPMHSVNAPN